LSHTRDGVRACLSRRWYSVYKSTGGDLVRDDSNARANEGCAWECEAGYVDITTAGGLRLCVEVGGTLYARYHTGG
jgi:hypothetical protein